MAEWSDRPSAGGRRAQKRPGNGEDASELRLIQLCSRLLLEPGLTQTRLEVKFNDFVCRPKRYSHRVVVFFLQKILIMFGNTYSKYDTICTNNLFSLGIQWHSFGLGW